MAPAIIAKWRIMMRRRVGSKLSLRTREMIYLSISSSVRLAILTAFLDDTNSQQGKKTYIVLPKYLIDIVLVRHIT